jgi:predicted NBD/HSP70 family sugar kinase
MSVYVGIDVHRKRSQVAVIDQDGEVLANSSDSMVSAPNTPRYLACRSRAADCRHIRSALVMT